MVHAALPPPLSTQRWGTGTCRRDTNTYIRPALNFSVWSPLLFHAQLRTLPGITRQTERRALNRQKPRASALPFVASHCPVKEEGGIRKRMPALRARKQRFAVAALAFATNSSAGSCSSCACRQRLSAICLGEQTKSACLRHHRKDAEGENGGPNGGPTTYCC